jgi:hypothetical protein
MRRMLNGILLDGEGGRGLAGAHATEALEGFLERAERPSASHRFPESYTVERDEVYEDHAWHFGQGSSVGRALKDLLDTNLLVYALERGNPESVSGQSKSSVALAGPGGAALPAHLMGVLRRLFKKARGQTRRRDGVR